MKYFILLFVLCIFSSEAFSQAEYVTEYDVPYSSKTDDYSLERLKLDIHHSVSGRELPIIVWFHGGGLTSGEKSIPGELMNQGYVVIAPNYRLIPDVSVNECIDDAAEAVAWVLDNGEKYGGDPNKVFYGN